MMAKEQDGKMPESQWKIGVSLRFCSSSDITHILSSNVRRSDQQISMVFRYAYDTRDVSQAQRHWYI